MLHRKVKFRRKLNGVKFEYIRLISTSIDDMEKVWGDPIFFDVLVNEIEASNGLEGELSHWGDRTPLEIYNQLCGTFDVATNTWVVDLEVQTYYSIKRVIGYGVASDDIIRVNTKYLSAYTVEDPHDRMEVGSNLTHEESHNCGFDHDSSQTARRKNSLSYLLNRVYERAYKIIIIDKNPTPVIIEEPTVTPAPIPVPKPSPLPPKAPTPPVGNSLPVKTYFPWYKRLWNWMRG